MKNSEQATFAAGCFWGVEERFRTTEGVLSTSVGYIGGDITDPTYEMVCKGDTGHAEAVHIEFDPQAIDYKELLHIFWDLHDPTTLNRQGPDIGHQYRSAVFYHNEEQRRLALETKTELDDSGKYHDKIVTEIVPAQEFYQAEEYHQKYVMKTGRKVC